MSLSITVLSNVRRFGISIPDSTATPAGTNLLSLLKAQGYDGPDACVVAISGYQANSSSQRAAFAAASGRAGAAVVAGDFTTHGVYIAAGDEYTVACDRDAALTSVRSFAGGAAVPAVVTVLF